MSRNMGLNTKVLRAYGTLTLYEGDDYLKWKNVITHFCNSSENHIIHYYYIYHYDDASKCNHYHFIFLYNTQIRLQTILNKLVALLHCKADQVGVEKLHDLNAMLRYFLHIDEDESKKRYDVSEIISDESIDQLKDYINSDDDTLTAKRLFALVLHFDDVVDLMYYLDLPTYHRYRSEIKTLYDNRLHLLSTYKHLINKDVSNDDNDLPF